MNDEVVTKEYLDSKGYVTKEYLDSKEYVTKEYLESKKYVTEGYLEKVLDERFTKSEERMTARIEDSRKSLITEITELFDRVINTMVTKDEFNDFKEEFFGVKDTVIDPMDQTVRSHSKEIKAMDKRITKLEQSHI